METIVNSVITSIQKNGYPEKRVALPFKSIFQACKKRDISMATVLKALEERDVFHEMRDDRILFFPKGYQPADKPDAGPIPEDMYKAAMEKLNEMDPAEVEKMKQRIMSMSPEEREALMKQARDLFGKG